MLRRMPGGPRIGIQLPEAERKVSIGEYLAMARAAGAYCVVDDGGLVLYLERGGKSLLTHGDAGVEHMQALIGIATAGGRVEIQKVDGMPVTESRLAPLLREAGFSSTHRGLVAYGAG